MSKIPSKEIFQQEWLKELPQAKHIDAENAQAWYDAVVEVEPERFKWHFERLKGIGGSEIGEIVAWKLDQRNLFKNVFDIIKSKLMITHPEPSNNNMRRGTLLEPIVQHIFQEDFGARTDEIKKNAINNFRSEQYPWLRGNTDDVVIMDEPPNEMSYIADYKAPSQSPGSSTNIQYATQLHQYNFILGLIEGKQEGEPGADGMLLAPLDYAKGVVSPIEVAYDPQIITAMITGGNEIWNHVLTGTFPILKQKELTEVQYTDAEKNNIEILEENFMRYKILTDVLDKTFKESKTKLTAALSKGYKQKLKTAKNPMEILSLTIRETPNNKKISNFIMESRLDKAMFQKLGTKYDTEKMLMALEDFGVNSDDYLIKQWDVQKIKKYCEENNIDPPISESICPTLRPKKIFSKEDILIAKDSAEQLLSGIRDQITIGSERENGVIIEEEKALTQNM